jgi:hypothetical protein
MCPLFDMKRFWPLAVILLCWLTVFLVPATRYGARTAWKLYGSPPPDVSDRVAVSPFKDLSPAVAVAVRQFPNEKVVRVVAAMDSALRHNLDVALKMYPRDTLLIRLMVDFEAKNLPSGRPYGPLSNPKYPAAAPKVVPLTSAQLSKWHEIIELARRGQKLEPQNTYFDWVLIHALLATNQDDEVRQVLTIASKKSDFDNHNRDQLLYRVAFREMTEGVPLSPSIMMRGEGALSSESGARTRDAARAIMDMVISDRDAGEHNRAVDVASDLLKLSRVLRLNSYYLNDCFVGLACERVALYGAAAPAATRVPGLGGASSLFRSHPRSIYRYAKASGRPDVLTFFDREWVELGKWESALTKLYASPWRSERMRQAVVLMAAERLRAIILRTLPFALLLCAIAYAISRRFRRAKMGPLALWPGIAFGAFTLVVLLAFDTLLALTTTNENLFWGDWEYYYLLTNGILSKAPSWVDYGIAGALLCLGVNRAVRWQRQQCGAVGLKHQLKSAFQPPEDGLAHLDFGWLFGWVARTTVWVISLGGLTMMCWNMSEAVQSLAWVVPLLAVLGSVSAHAWYWRHHAHRRQTLRFMPQEIFEVVMGFLLAMSIIYALTAFAFLPLALAQRHENQKSSQVGEVKEARARMRL